MDQTAVIIDKINEVKTELRKNGLWKKETPGWISEYRNKDILTYHDFSDWLQFIYLPNLKQQVETENNVANKNLVVPQAIQFFGNDVKKGKLLQLLIELDSL